MTLIAFDGIDNFRDFGAAPAADGARVRSGRLYRSGHHGRASDADLERLAELNLALVCDLRRPEERERDPCRRPAVWGARLLEDDHPDPAPDGYQAFLRESDHSVGEMRRFLEDYYARAPFEPRLVLIWSRFFAALAVPGGPALIHCAAGKDRTGVLAALVHQTLGVPFEATLEDYLKTNDPERIERRLAPFGDYVESVAGRRPSDAAIRATLGVEARYLEIAFDKIRKRAGSVDAYLRDALGVDAAMARGLREALLE